MLKNSGNASNQPLSDFSFQTFIQKFFHFRDMILTDQITDHLQRAFIKKSVSRLFLFSFGLIGPRRRLLLNRYFILSLINMISFFNCRLIHQTLIFLFDYLSFGGRIQIHFIHSYKSFSIPFSSCHFFSQLIVSVVQQIAGQIFPMESKLFLSDNLITQIQFSKKFKIDLSANALSKVYYLLQFQFFEFDHFLIKFIFGKIFSLFPQIQYRFEQLLFSLVSQLCHLSIRQAWVIQIPISFHNWLYLFQNFSSFLFRSCRNFIYLRFRLLLFELLSFFQLSSFLVHLLFLLTDLPVNSQELFFISKFVTRPIRNTHLQVLFDLIIIQLDLFGVFLFVGSILLGLIYWFRIRLFRWIRNIFSILRINILRLGQVTGVFNVRITH